MKTQGQTPTELGDRVACSADLSNLPRLLALVSAACQQNGVGAELTHDLHLIAEEACVNVMRHAYPPGQAGPLTLAVSVCQRGGRPVIVLVLADQGRPFDPLSAAPADTTAPAETRAVGGLGVHLIRELSDHQHYRREPDRGNVFTIEKYLDRSEPS